MMATEDCELFTRLVRRRAYRDEQLPNFRGNKPEDIRLSTPGIDWNLISDLRRKGVEDFKQKIGQVFSDILRRTEERFVTCGPCCTSPATRCEITGAATFGTTVSKKPASPVCSTSALQSPRVSIVSSQNSGMKPFLQPSLSVGLVLSDQPEHIQDPIVPSEQMESSLSFRQMPPEQLGPSLSVESISFEQLGPSLLVGLVPSEQVELSKQPVLQVQTVPSIHSDHLPETPVSPIVTASLNRTSVVGHTCMLQQTPSVEIPLTHRFSSGLAASNHMIKKMPAKQPPEDCELELQSSFIVSKKRLRSVSIERLDIVPPAKRQSQSQDSTACGNLDNDLQCITSEGHSNENATGIGDKNILSSVSNNQDKKRPLVYANFISNFYAKKADFTHGTNSAVKPVSSCVKTFLHGAPTSPKLAEKAEKLVEKVISKQDNEKRRKDLEAKKEQERLERIRKREERAKKVLENQAALCRERDEKKKVQEQKLMQEVPTKKQYIIQQKIQELHRKGIERQQQAAEARRKQEELKSKKLQDLKIPVEKQPPGPKLEAENKLKFEVAKQADTEQVKKEQEEQERMRIEKLFDIKNKKPFEPLKVSFATGGVTPVSSSKQQTAVLSYDMTPADPISVYENYSIGDLSSDDSTDEENSPKKPIPGWAHNTPLTKWMANQENCVESNMIDVCRIFPPSQLLRSPDLLRIFNKKKKAFLHRSSSAQWNSPMFKH